MVAAGAGAASAAFGALILGEYDFSGVIPYVAGLLFGLVIAEVVLSVARRATPALTVVAPVETGLGLAWAVWISSGRGVSPVPAAAFVSVALGIVVALGWSFLSGHGHRPGAAGGSQDGAVP